MKEKMISAKRVLYLTIGILFGMLLCSDLVWGWDGRGCDPRSFRSHQAFHSWAHHRAIRIQCQKERRKYHGSTRSFQPKTTYQNG